jgi:hypothetical protein
MWSRSIRHTIWRSATAAAPTTRVRIEAIGAGHTRMSIEMAFPSIEAMEEVLAMGTDEGLTQAVGQIDAILAEGALRSV